ncbi:MAG: class I SAM-dependent DNA methyltransferase, partial [Planctomycetota bacterium]|nr:class I SAM-dependent DNA methyltransferase [Planctomycetota bacterium]
AKALNFAERWKAAAREKAQSQPFIIDFLRVFGVEDPERSGDFEFKVPLGDRHGYIDYLWKGKIAVEMKTRGEDLNKAYDQLRGYALHLPANDMPDLLLVCDFENMVLYRRTTGEKSSFKTKSLSRQIRRFAEIAGYETVRLRENQIEVNVKAAEKMAQLHDALKEHGYGGHDLEVYLVRLLFCLFADDTGIFPRGSFANYLENSRPDGRDLTQRLAQWFETLDQPAEARAKRDLLAPELRQLNYVNGNLFAGRLPGADFNAAMRELLLDCCRFDWSGISPAVFGAMFQGVMDRERRRELGAHYTSEENILKLINPLFMDGLWAEFERVKVNPGKLDEFHHKIAGLRFLDPACGCGNFLIIAYRELRLLELEILKMKVGGGQRKLDISTLLRVGVEQFSGIEIEDFPCQIAQTGMWLTDHQMNLLVSGHFGMNYVRLPLLKSANIVHANALALDWEGVAPKGGLSYILGNPPFSGARIMGAPQKSDMRRVFGEQRGAGNLDYVTAWYKKAADFMDGAKTRAAFVSTNSISQGEQPALLWEPLFARRGIKIDFARRTFKWSNEARGKAAVHCVVIGFSQASNGGGKTIFAGDGKGRKAKNINPYLVDAPTVFIKGRSRPLCDVPEIGIGNKPIDGGHYLFTEEEKRDFIGREPGAKKWFRPWIGSDEFINRYRRYCLWLGDCPPVELRRLPEVLKRVEAVRRYRLASKSEGTRKLADTPTRFHVENMPGKTYVLMPRVSSELRNYIPIGFIRPNILTSDSAHIIPNATLYHFGVLTSGVHMAWVRVVCGRLKNDYRYSKDIVYNNFPWPETGREQKDGISGAAKEVLDAREMFPGASLADLYDPLT